jgi:hypothetical protein
MQSFEQEQIQIREIKDVKSMGGNSSVGRASAFQAEGRRFEPGFPLQSATLTGVRQGLVEEWSLAHVAQSVEHFLGKEEVTGSNPVMGSSHTGLRMSMMGPVRK